MRHSLSCFCVFSNLCLLPERHTDANDKRIVVTDKFLVTGTQRSNDRASVLMRIVLSSLSIRCSSHERFIRVFPRKPPGAGRARDRRVFYDPCKHRKTRGECFLLARKRASINFTRNHLPSFLLRIGVAKKQKSLGEVVDRLPYIIRNDRERGRTRRFLTAPCAKYERQYKNGPATMKHKFWNLRNAKPGGKQR